MPRWDLLPHVFGASGHAGGGQILRLRTCPDKTCTASRSALPLTFPSPLRTQRNNHENPQGHLIFHGFNEMSHRSPELTMPRRDGLAHVFGASGHAWEANSAPRDMAGRQWYSGSERASTNFPQSSSCPTKQSRKPTMFFWFIEIIVETRKGRYPLACIRVSDSRLTHLRICYQSLAYTLRTNTNTQP